MPNYGHAVSLGVLIDTRIAPREAVDLAVRADGAGLDLALFTEHDDASAPDDASASDDVPAFDDGTASDQANAPERSTDPWALATWAAGRTERITVGVAGLNATGHPPAVLARAAGSLSALSGNRAALSLAVPGDQQVPRGERVGERAEDRTDERAEDRTDELTDAIEVFRAVLDTSTDRATYTGAHHTIRDVQPGPVLPLEFPVWLSGSDSAAAERAATMADGLLIDIEAVGGVSGLIHMNDVIDQAAVRAGRDPREIRRLVVVSPPWGSARDHRREGDLGVQQEAPAQSQVEAWAQELVRLVVDHGASGLLLRQDITPSAVGLFAAEIAPRVRAAVTEALPDLGSRPIRRAAVRAKRHPGIDYDGVPASLAHHAVEPGDPAYARVKSTYLRGGAPGLVLRPEFVEQVVEAVDYARQNPHLELGIRSGGHGLSGRSTNHGGLVIDLGRRRRVEVLDEATRLVRLEPGARWRDVASALQPYGWAIGSGDYGGVGVGGLVTAGGVGFLSRNHGLTIDNVRAAELVLADGSRLRASHDQHPEVFWAVRGAGANIGIVTAVEISASPVSEVGWAQLGFQVPDVAQFLSAFGAVATSAPRQTTAFLIMGPSRGGSATAQVMAMVDSDDPDVIIEQLQPFAQIPTLIQQQVVIAPYAAVMTTFPDQPHQGRKEPVSRSGLLTEVSPAFAEDAAALLDSGTVHWFQLRTMGGAIGDVSPEATAFVHRDAQMHVTAMGANAQRLDTWWGRVRRHFQGLYLSFETDRSPERLVEAFGEKGLMRLSRLNRELDPHQLFRDNFAVTPQRFDDQAPDDDPSGEDAPSGVAASPQGGPYA